MDKNLKKVFDAFDEKETDKLLEGIDVKECNEHGLDVDRIMKRVYQETGVENKTDTQTGRIIAFPWKKAGRIAAVAACFLLVFIGGYFAGGLRDDTSQSQINNGEDVADADTDTDKRGTDDNAVTDGSDTDETVIPGADGEDKAVKDDNTEESDKKDKSKNKNGKNKDDSSDNTDNKGSNKLHSGKNKNGDKINDKIMMGVDEDSRYLGMTDNDIEELLAESDSVIDMESLGSTYASVNEMVNDSDYVIKAAKTSSLFKKSDKKHVYRLASKVTVKSVLVNNIEEELSKDSSIKINEGILYSADDKCYTQVAGYTRMKLGYEYILFLKRSASGKSYDIAGTVFGKVPMDKSEPVLNTDSDYSDADKINDVKYIIESARRKYSDYNPNNSDKSDKTEKSDKADKTDNVNSSNNSNSTNNSNNSADSDKKDSTEKPVATEAPVGEDSTSAAAS